MNRLTEWESGHLRIALPFNLGERHAPLRQSVSPATAGVTARSATPQDTKGSRRRMPPAGPFDNVTSREHRDERRRVQRRCLKTSTTCGTIIGRRR